jgi:hypothetical protein
MFSLMIASCAPTRHIIPLDKGEHSVSLALGGPLITYSDNVIPVPLLSACYGYGLDSNITVFGGAHITSALFGVLQADIGGRYYFQVWDDDDDKSLEATLGASLIPAIDIWEGNFKLWPELMGALRWNISDFMHLYTVFGGMFELSSTRAHGQDQPINFMPLLGVGFVVQSTNWDYQFEYKLIAPGENNKGTVVEYRAAGDTGARGIYFSVGRRFAL